MPTYIQKIINSDLTPFADINKEMSVGSGVDTLIAFSGITTSTPKSFGFITISGVPNSTAWENGGTWTVEIQADISNAQINAQIRCIRLDTSGNILQSGVFTAIQSLQVDRIFNPVVPTWNGAEENVDNRLAVEILLTTVQSMDQSISIGLGTTDNEVVTTIMENHFLATESESTNLFILGHETTNIRGTDLVDSIFFVDNGTDKVHRVPIDIPKGQTAATRTDVVGLISGLTTPADIAIDLNSQEAKMYWSDGGTNKIQRSNLDGSNIEDIIIGTSNVQGIALDLQSDKLYFVDTGTNKVHRANLDGTNQEDLIGNVSSPKGIVLDIPSGHLYFTTAGGTKVRRANLDGSNETALVATDTSAAGGIVLDLVNRNMYWADSSQAIIKRAGMEIPSGQTPMNRTDVTDIVTGLTNPNWVACDPIKDKLYWTDTGTDKIQRSNLDGSNQEDILATGLLTPLGLALITSSDKLDLFITSAASESGSMTLFIPGPQQKTEQLDLFLGGIPTESGGLNLFTNALDISQNNLNLIINGHKSISGSLDLTLASKDKDNNSLDLILLAVDTENTSLDLFTKSKDINNNNLDLFLAGHKTLNANLDLVILTKDIESNSLDLFISSRQIASGDIDLFAASKDSIISNVSLLIVGHTTSNNDLDLFLSTKNIAVGVLDLIVLGHTPISNSLDLFIIGNKSIDTNIDLFMASKDEQDDALSLVILGKDNIQANIDLVIEGSIPDEIEFTLFIKGLDVETNALDLTTTGHIETTSSTEIKIKRDSTITDSPFDDTNLGLTQSLKVGHDGISNRVLLSFDISDIPSGSFIQRAEIHGLALTNASGTQEFRSHPVTKDWVEDEVSWNELSSGVAWVNPGSDFVSNIFDSWTIASTSGQVKTDIVATNVIQNAVNSGLVDANVLLKERIESSVTTQISSQQNPSGGPILIIKFSIDQPNLNLCIPQSHETIISSGTTLFAIGVGAIDTSGDLFIRGSGIIPLSGQMPLCINGVIAKTDDPADPTCPPLDPTASIQISDELIGIYQSRIDALINQLGKNIILEFAKIKTPCPNCLFDTMRERSTGIFRSGGPRPFARGRTCPWCKGDGFEKRLG